MKKLLIYILLAVFLSITCTACNTGSNDNSKTEFKKSRFPAKEGRMLLNQGIRKMQSNDTTGAITDFQALIKEYPDLPIAYYNLGLAYAKNNQLNEAVNEWETVIMLDGNYADAYYNLGLGYKLLHNNRKAQENLINYAVLRPQDPNINKIKKDIQALKEPILGRGIIGRISLSDEIDAGSNTVLNSKSIFHPETPYIYTSIDVADASPNTEILAKWYYLTPDKQKVPVNLGKVKVNGSKKVLFSLKKPDGEKKVHSYKKSWPTGKYELDIIIDNEINAVVPFDILK